MTRQGGVKRWWWKGKNGKFAEMKFTWRNGHKSHPPPKMVLPLSPPLPLLLQPDFWLRLCTPTFCLSFSLSALFAVWCIAERILIWRIRPRLACSRGPSPVHRYTSTRSITWYTINFFLPVLAGTTTCLNKNEIKMFFLVQFLATRGLTVIKSVKLGFPSTSPGNGKKKLNEGGIVNHIKEKKEGFFH